jgi:hypothetical protein
MGNRSPISSSMRSCSDCHVWAPCCPASTTIWIDVVGRCARPQRASPIGSPSEGPRRTRPPRRSTTRCGPVRLRERAGGRRRSVVPWHPPAQQASPPTSKRAAPSRSCRTPPRRDSEAGWPGGRRQDGHTPFRGARRARTFVYRIRSKAGPGEPSSLLPEPPLDRAIGDFSFSAYLPVPTENPSLGAGRRCRASLHREFAFVAFGVVCGSRHVSGPGDVA